MRPRRTSPRTATYGTVKRTGIGHPARGEAPGEADHAQKLDLQRRRREGEAHRPDRVGAPERRGRGHQLRNRGATAGAQGSRPDDDLARSAVPS